MDVESIGVKSQTVESDLASHDFRCGSFERRYELFGITFDVYISDPKEVLVFCFDDLTMSGSVINRTAWGYSFCKKQNRNAIGVLEGERNGWYRSSDMSKCIEFLSRLEFVQSASKRISYGTSMGGFAAIAFSRILKIDLVLALSPISTLSKECDWDDRYGSATTLDWDSGYFDVPEDFAGTVWIVYDPLFSYDRKHANRIKAKVNNSKLLRIFGFEHSTAKYLNQIKLLNELFNIAIIGNFNDLDNWIAKTRCKRNLDKYYFNMIKGCMDCSKSIKTVFIVIAKFFEHCVATSKNELEILDRVTRVLDSLGNRELVYNISKKLSFLYPRHNYFLNKLNQDDNKISSFEHSVNLRRAGKYLESIQMAKESIVESPGNTRPYRQIASIYLDLNMREEARIYIDKALEMEPLESANINLLEAYESQ